MSIWHTFLIAALTLALSLAGVCALLAMLYHVRLEAAWMGMWTGGAELPHENFLRLEHGFPGFMRPLAPTSLVDNEDDDDVYQEDGKRGGKTQDDTMRAAPAASPQPAPMTAPVAETPATTGKPAEDIIATPSVDLQESSPETTVEAAASGGGKEAPRVAEARPGATASPSATNKHAPNHHARDNHTHKARRRRAKANQFRRALFRFVTDGPAWRLQSGYFLRCARSAFRLANARLELSAGHPDPATLGRFAGYWYAASPLLPTHRVAMGFRFEDRHPSFGVRVTAAFSLFSVARFLARVLLTFPYVRLSRRALYGWRHRRLDGWRAFVYRKIQAF